jgi:hypothetical protein
MRRNRKAIFFAPHNLPLMNSRLLDQFSMLTVTQAAFFFASARQLLIQK